MLLTGKCLCGVGAIKLIGPIFLYCPFYYTSKRKLISSFMGKIAGHLDEFYITWLISPFICLYCMPRVYEFLLVHFGFFMKCIILITISATTKIVVKCLIPEDNGKIEKRVYQTDLTLLSFWEVCRSQFL